jgi:hypothetical protein
VNYGPRIIRSGLILALDAADRNSYLGSGTSWTDLSGNNNNCTLVNSPTFNSSDGGSIVFNGTNQYGNVTNATSLNVTTQTISVWFKYNSITVNGNSIISKIDVSTSNNGWNFYLYNNTINIQIKVATVGYGLSASVQSGFWYNCVMTFTSNGTINGYINGRSFGSTSVPAFTMSTQPLRIARAIDTYWGYYTGSVSNLSVYNRVLSQAEILQNYNATKSRFRL